MSKEFAPKYIPADIEEDIYQKWEKSGYFNPDKLPKRHKKPFTIIMPPPNANGALHIGHAVFVTLQDIMIRFQRMRGRKTLWLPGADHAGFETQVVFDKKLTKEKRNRFAMPRDELYQEMLNFTLENKKGMEAQLRRLGASCDWSRAQFTLDPEIIKTTQETFIQMHKDGLLYRDNRIVNWCVKHQTTLSDLEVAHEERIDPLYYMKYGPFTLATVRPETKFGDTAVAVHPKDTRYKKYIGQEIEIDTLLGRARIKVIADEAVDKEFGTGVVKVTPAHDPNDFEMSKRHDLEVREVIGRDGRLNEKTGPYKGLKIMEAREKVSKDLFDAGLMQKIDPSYKHSVAICYKCRNIVEPLVIPQWFVAMTKAIGKKQSLRDTAVDAVRSKKIEFTPKRLEKVFFHWMKNLRDWNISRQIVWGIRIPAWFCDCPQTTEHITVSVEKPKQKCSTCKSDWKQDPDVLDTWFSSGQWPYATLNYPDGKDLKEFYPTDVMETGWDILFFWVARMIIFGLYRTGDVPFKTVYLNGLVRDKDRQKMSKSKGNVIDPLGVAETYGTDALRMALVIGNLPGNDIIISEDKIRGYRNFATKLWNIQRFILMCYDPKLTTLKATPSKKDKKNLEELKKITATVTTYMEAYKLHHAADTLYHYTWHTFADKIIEDVKPRLESEDPHDKVAAQETLVAIQTTLLKLLHPFIPFVTEALWNQLPKDTETLLMIEEWPE